MIDELRLVADRHQRDRLLSFATRFKPRTWAIDGAGGRVARAGATKARAAAANQFHSICDTAPASVRGQLRGLSTRRKMTVAGPYRAGDPLAPTCAAKTALTSIARRWSALDTEIRALDRDIKSISTPSPRHCRPATGSATRPPAPSCAPPVTTPTG